MTGLLALVACQNRAPELLAMNGQAPRAGGPLGALDPLGFRYVDFPGQRLEPGEVVPLDVEVKDPDGDPVAVYFSDMPGVVSFDPHGTGTLEVFDLGLDPTFGPHLDARIVLTDDRSPPSWREYVLFYGLQDETGDTGGR